MKIKNNENVLKILKSKAEVYNQPQKLSKIASAYTAYQSLLLLGGNNSISLCGNNPLIQIAILMSMTDENSSLTILSSDQENQKIGKLAFDLEFQCKLNYLFTDIDHLVRHMNKTKESYSAVLLSSDQIKYVPALILNKVVSVDTTLLIEKPNHNVMNNISIITREGFKVLFSSEELVILAHVNKFEYKEDYFNYYSEVLNHTYDNCILTSSLKRLSVTVGIVAYNIENYIEECLQSVINQKGNFDFDIILSEDCSLDCTRERIEYFINKVDIPPNCKIHYIKNRRNLGLVKNYQKVISTASEIGNDYFILLDGDDYFLSSDRIQKHLTFLENCPELAMSFDSILLYSERTKRFYLDEQKQNFEKDVFTLFDLLENNFMATCSVVRGDLINSIPDNLFSIFTADWFLHIWLAQFGLIGFMNKPMFVYRQRSDGDWSGRKTIVNYQRLYKAINDLGRISNYKYFKYMNSYQNQLIDHIFDEPFFDLNLLIIDDVFPHPANGYRLQEFESYLDVFPNMKIFSTGVWSHLLGNKTNTNIVELYKQEHPKYADNIICWDRKYNINGNISANIAYIVFLGNAFPSLDFLERNKIPFILELYPGGSFGLNNPQSDFMLMRVMSSPCFRKVIVTQDATRDYLLGKRYCEEDDIIFIFGVVVPKKKLLGLKKPKKHYGQNKERLDVCFVAMKYTEFGVDKGYDIFVGLAKKIKRLHNNIFFHVVGGFDANVLDVKDISDVITFYGYQEQDWFDDFYVDKDIIISPNLDGITNNGAFDGFPTAACTEAGLYETAIFCSDPLDLNNGRFRNHVDIEIVDRNIDAYVEMVEYYINEPDELIELSIKGREKIRDLYSIETQMKPRINLIENEILNYPYFKTMMKQEKNKTKSNTSDNSIDAQLSIKGQENDKKFSQSNLFHWLRILRDAILVRKSGLFDKNWYLQEYVDVKKARVDPIYHYLKYGWREGRNPSGKFDQNHYLEVNTDVRISGLNPLVHYIKFGISEDREIYPVDYKPFS